MRERTHDTTTGAGYETPAGAEDVDEALTEWEEMLSIDVNSDDRTRHADAERRRERWRADPENAPEGAAENVRRMDDYEDLYPEPAENAGVIRTVVGALDPRTFNRKSIWLGVILVLLAGIVIPFVVASQLAIAVGVPTAWANVIGVGITVAYWKFF